MEGILSIMLLVCSALLIMSAILTTPDEVWEKEAIDRGYAIYCSNTGNFAWKGECDE